MFSNLFFYVKIQTQRINIELRADLIVVLQIKDIGILLSSDLSISNHINKICNKALCTFGFIQRN